MNKNRFLLAIVILLALNLIALVVHTIVVRANSGKTIKEGRAVTEAPAAARPQTAQAPKPAAVIAPQPQPLRIVKCEQVSMSSNRLARVRLLFNGPVATNSLASHLSFKAA